MAKVVKAMALAAGLTASLVRAQFTYPTCDELKAADFRATELFNKNGSNGAGATDASLEEPVQMDLHAVRKGDPLSPVDIYFVQRLGVVKRYDGTTKKVSPMGTIPVWGKVDNGLMGLALHPDFDNNHWIYFWYSPDKLAGQNRKMRLVRITATPDHKLDMASEKILIEILGSKSDQYHSGGPMTFDAYGDLWVTVGNNSPDLVPAELNVLSTTDSTKSAEWGPSNTASLRGGIFRIHPDNSAKGYSLPPTGNFGDHWAGQFESQGNATLAAQYRNPAKVLPELYVKGNRSNYSIAVHPTKRWLAWGEVNYASSNDEFNLVTKPVFAGYPYFHANNAPTGAHDKSALTPKNTSPFNSGVTDLPPATPGTINNMANTSISGPFYVFDPGLNIKTKFPPHLHLSWITFGWIASRMYIHTLDTVAVKVKKSDRVDNALLAGVKLRNPLQAKFGPDGSLYILNYDGRYSSINPAITRVDYVGTCHLPVSARTPESPALAWNITLSPGALAIGEAGDHEFTLHDPSGRLLARHRGKGPATYSLRDIRNRPDLKAGIYFLRVKTPKGAYIRNLAVP